MNATFPIHCIYDGEVQELYFEPRHELWGDMYLPHDEQMRIINACSRTLKNKGTLVDHNYIIYGCVNGEKPELIFDYSDLWR